MQTAAKEKTFLLWMIASAVLFGAPSLASSSGVLHLKNRAEKISLGAENGIGQEAFDAAKHVENYDSLWEVASESSVAPSSGANRSLPILDNSFTPKAPLHELLMEQAGRRGFATRQSEALFWSGLGGGRDGIVRSQRFALENGGRTLEMTPGGKYLNDLDLFGRNSPISQAEAMQVWEFASRRFARGASGQVRAVTGSVRPSSVFNRIEYPELISNPNVWGIDVLNLLPKIGLR
jgi:hypothetical protein